MRLFVDLDLQKIVVGAGTTQEVTSVSVKRSPSAQIEVQFLRRATPQELSSSASGILEVKTAGEYDSSPLAAALAWVKTGTGTDTIYTFSLNLVNVPLNALLKVDALHAVTVVAATDLFTSVAHGLSAGNIIQFSSTVTLPAGVSPNTDYYVIASGLTADAFKVSTVLAGSTINVTDTGTGIHSWRYTVDDVESVTLMAEIQWIDNAQAVKTQTFDFVLINDVIREGDVPPSTLALVYALFLPEIATMADFKAVPTTSLSLGFLAEILIDVAGTLTWLTYRLESGPTTDIEPAQVEPDDYDLSTNNVHWQGAVGPAGGTGLSAGLSYKFNTATSGDPGTGKLLINSGTIALATQLNISETDDDGNALAAMLNTWDDGTSTIRGRVLFYSPATPTKFAMFDITGTRTDAGAYDTFVAAHVASGGSFSNGLAIRVLFIPKGDKGDQGDDAGFNYLFNSATSGDPGTGKFLFNHATFTSATVFHISETDNAGNSLATFLTKQDDSTSTNKCLVLIRESSSTNYFAFYITAALTDAGTYDTFPITPISSSGGIATTDSCEISFIRTGDAGSAGASGGATGFFKYTFNDTTASDPTDGEISFSNIGTFTSITTVAIDAYEGDSLFSITGFLNTLDDGIGSRRAMLIGRNANCSVFFAFFVSAANTGTGHPIVLSVTPVSGGTIPADGEVLFISLIPMGGGDVFIQNAQPNTYGLVLADAGKTLFHDHASAHTWTIPANSSVPYQIGTHIIIINNNGGGNITLAITTDTLRRGDGTAGTGSRTIAADSIAEIIKTKSTEWMIRGTFT